MLVTAKNLKGYKLHGIDGEIGSVDQFYFDDRRWTVRYLVADTGHWLTGRQVLLSPHSIKSVDSEAHHVSIDLTKKQIEDSPNLSYDSPVSREFEGAYYGYYGWPSYWSGPFMWGAYPYVWRPGQERVDSMDSQEPVDHHIRSTTEVKGDHIQATDGEIGHVSDFIIDDKTWAIRYLVVDTANWWPGKKVLISPSWIDSISWMDSKVYVNLPRESIKSAPEYSEETLIRRDYEDALHTHYSRPGYWVDDNSPMITPEEARRRENPPARML